MGSEMCIRDRYKDHLTDAVRFFFAGALPPLKMKDGKAIIFPQMHPTYPDGIPGTNVVKNPIQIPNLPRNVYQHKEGHDEMSFNFAPVLAIAKKPVVRDTPPPRKTNYWPGRGVVG